MFSILVFFHIFVCLADCLVLKQWCTFSFKIVVLNLSQGRIRWDDADPDKQYRYCFFDTEEMEACRRLKMLIPDSVNLDRNATRPSGWLTSSTSGWSLSVGMLFLSSSVLRSPGKLAQTSRGGNSYCISSHSPVPEFLNLFNWRMRTWDEWGSIYDSAPGVAYMRKGTNYMQIRWRH